MGIYKFFSTSLCAINYGTTLIVSLKTICFSTALIKGRFIQPPDDRYDHIAKIWKLFISWQAGARRPTRQTPPAFRPPGTAR